MIRRDTRWETGIRSRIAVAKIILTAAQIFNKMQHEYKRGEINIHYAYLALCTRRFRNVGCQQKRCKEIEDFVMWCRMQRINWIERNQMNTLLMILNKIGHH